MAVDIELVKRIAHGTVAMIEADGAADFHRFTGEQHRIYEPNPDFWTKSFAASGVRLEFETDARRFLLGGTAGRGSSREFYFFDVYVNGALIRHVGNYSYKTDPDFRFDVELPEGTNRVAVYFPNLARISLSELEFFGCKKIVPITKKRRILCYGDSITQGYDAQYPSLSYANLVADAFDAEMINKGVGGDYFNPELAALPDAGRFDLVTVAYGTNDWKHKTRDVTRNAAERFFERLADDYPDTPICAILPIWRRDWMQVTQLGPFEEIYSIIRTAAGRHRNIKIVDGWTLLPHLESCVSDGLHPNDFGFQFMARNLLRQLPLV